jgi:hypothetical protein
MKLGIISSQDLHDFILTSWLYLMKYVVAMKAHIKQIQKWGWNSCVFFLANWGKISPSAGEAQPSQQEFIAPNRQPLLLHEVWGARLHPVTKKILPDFIAWGSFSASFVPFWQFFQVFLPFKAKPSVGSLPLMRNLLWGWSPPVPHQKNEFFFHWNSCKDQLRRGKTGFWSGVGFTGLRPSQVRGEGSLNTHKAPPWRF